MVILQFHLDATDHTIPFWWIDSPQVPSLYVSAPTPLVARRRAIDHLEGAGVDVDDVRCEFV